MSKSYKTFAELGVSFQEDEDCITCTGKSCHNNVTHKNGNDYNVHISCNEQDKYTVFAVPDASTESYGIIDEEGLTEREAVKFICDNFNWFKCF